MNGLTVIGVEVAKALIILALQEAQKAGMTKQQLEVLYQDVKTTFYASDPDKIPEVKNG